MRIGKTVSILIIILIEVLGFLLFLKGFFPVKSAVSGHASFSNLPPQPLQKNTEESINTVEPSSPAPPLFGRTIIILIDALRADFVFNTTEDWGMPYVKELIMKQESVSFVAKAHPPTVTMPRIKAMTTGGIPGFIDVVLNFDSRSLTEDNLITQLYRNEKKIVFYGDDTWMRLFPGHFLREDGTTSFFVTDYTEVDDNVTRHLPDELENRDWDVMILHYLGLDHIGHLAGPHSPLMGPKLMEMDKIVEKIHKAVIKQDSELEMPTLIVLCGDHGMSDQGSHGGSSLTEVSTPLVFLSSLYSNKKGVKMDWSTLQQIDLAPTLSTLLGIPIPQNSLGAVPLDVLWKYELPQALRAMQLNAYQVSLVYMQNVASYEKESAYIEYEQAIKQHESWLKMYYAKDQDVAIDKEQRGRSVMKAYRESITAMRDKITRSLATYDLHAMSLAIFMLWMVPLGSLTVLLTPDGSYVQLPTCGIVRWISVASGMVAVAGHITVCTSHNRSELLCPVASDLTDIVFVVLSTGMVFTIGAIGTLLSVAFVAMLKTLLIKISILPPFTKYFLIGNMLYIISLLSSSFVEEEHQTWYFFITTVYIAITCFAIKDLTLHAKFSCKDQQEQRDKYTKVKTDFGIVETNSFKMNLFANCFTEVSNTNFEMHEGNPDDDVCRNNSRSSEGNDIISDKKRRKDRLIPDWVHVIGVLVVLVLCRLLRTWNQTGVKWADQPDIGDWLVSPNNKSALSIVVAVSLVVMVYLLIPHVDDYIQKMMILISAVGIYAFRAANGNLSLPGMYSEVTKGIFEARIVYLLVTLSLLYTSCKLVKNLTVQHNAIQTFLQLSKSLFILWTLIITLLMRPHNIPLIVLILLQQTLISNYIVDHIEVFSEDSNVILLYMWMGNAAFFYQGNSNSITTVDVSAGYVGLDGYVPVLVGAMMCVSTYAGPVFWFLGLLLKLSEKCAMHDQSLKQLRGRLLLLADLLILSQSIPNAVYTVLVTVNRYHLFVWSVFSPKLLYQGMILFVSLLEVMAIIVICFVLEKLLPKEAKLSH